MLRIAYGRQPHRLEDAQGQFLLEQGGQAAEFSVVLVAGGPLGEQWARNFEDLAVDPDQTRFSAGAGRLVILGENWRK